MFAFTLPHEGHDHGAHHWAPALIIIAALVGVAIAVHFARRAREVTRG